MNFAYKFSNSKYYLFQACQQIMALLDLYSQSCFHIDIV
jgi:hypothetical protein